MARVTFITSNAKKAEYLQKYLGIPIDHQAVDQDELQLLDIKAVARHKAEQAYALLNKPVLVEDVGLEFSAFGSLPGTYIKHFIQELGLEKICRLLDPFEDRSAVGRCAYAYCDANGVRVFEGSLKGVIATHPLGESGYGWDPIFVPDGYEVSRAQLSARDYEDVYLKIKPIRQVAEFLKML